ncbi:TetR/AcrR family transcriptional regulator [Chitinophaga sancti]|uniref:TetR/AcrR family transcriptional regulator n=1 Tax=Chitinophaga sancti TaxID=1004 RepID=A0A1K1R3Z2_9BACT|nr:TetR/AcrR family transcriptional regulator [Chitinophaga sancti]WQD64299.1 TetR/AcrR family transcriptional regulator [Chitinophaga sancti]WQG90077.1 TetR/AcrR family transcriptional regulator [Chitinophaga sancti]SFW66644.1 transcriptional regulator, TetR family [Chitinophaga sancti]
MSKAEKTRQYIVEKTAPIFNTKGFAGTSLTDMTEATGLTKGSIYGNFANKDEVALACFDFNFKKVVNIIDSAIEKEATYRGKLLVYTTIYDNFLNAPFPTGGCPVLNTAIESDDTHPSLRAKSAEAIGNWKNKIAGILNKGIEAGEFKPGLDVEQTALTFIATIEGAIMITKATGKLNYRTAILNAIENMINAL